MSGDDIEPGERRGSEFDVDLGIVNDSCCFLAAEGHTDRLVAEGE